MSKVFETDDDGAIIETWEHDVYRWDDIGDEELEEICLDTDLPDLSDTELDIICYNPDFQVELDYADDGEDWADDDVVGLGPGPK